jgi:hypothetical protein
MQSENLETRIFKESSQLWTTRKLDPMESTMNITINLSSKKDIVQTARFLKSYSRNTLSPKRIKRKHQKNKDSNIGENTSAEYEDPTNVNLQLYQVNITSNIILKKLINSNFKTILARK